MIPEKIFKAYDIRGIYPTELNPDVAYSVGQAYAQLTDARRVVVGRDMRLGSPELAKKLIEGITSQGVNVDDIGMVPIDAVYFALGKFKYDGGVMVTASHNPKEYNGFKMAIRGKGIEYIRGTELLAFLKGKHFDTKKKPGNRQERNILDEYIRHVVSFADVNKVKPFTIVVDAGNGMAGKVMPRLFEQLPCKLVPLNFELDGNFPSHPSNPLLPESRVQLHKAVLHEHADFGVIMDGDTDRLFFITEQGEFIRADTTLLLLAQYFLNAHPGAGIAYNVICSKAVPEKIRAWGGKPIRTAVGFVNVSQGMRDHGGIMGGEVSAHYSFRDNYFADSGFIAFALLLMLISDQNKPLSRLVEGLNPYFRSDEINIEIANIPQKIEAVRKRFHDGKQDELDGLTVEYEDWWFNVRPSNTEPLLRITVEANIKTMMEQKSEELVAFIKGA